MESDEFADELDKEFVVMLEKVASENKEGLEKLAREEIAEERQKESWFHKLLRVSKRKLGLRDSDAVKIQL